MHSKENTDSPIATNNRGNKKNAPPKEFEKGASS